ncbi:MAG: ParB/RepB/Spo0J family partition protein [Oscillospiraceae bacterium]|jgi:ParB family chromosome partitioning protein|nr:ParB/RepB/Spo0J family partition protein [Oscillospiraceae bacterium]
MAKGSKEKLGRGLDALWFDNSTSDGTSTIQLRISEIEPNRSQPRRRFDENSLTELADSIRQHGVLQPLMVRPLASGGYQIVAGERRWRACRMANITEVPAIVREMTDQEVMEIALIENLQREDLNIMEEAAGYQCLLDQYGMTQEQIAARVGKSRPVIANALRLLRLPAPVAELVKDGSLSAGHARALLSISQPDVMLEMARKAANGSATVRDIERLGKKLRNAENQNPGEPSAAPADGEWNVGDDPYFRELELSLSESLGRKVRVRFTHGPEKGALELEFYSKEDLENLAKEAFGHLI